MRLSFLTGAGVLTGFICFGQSVSIGVIGGVRTTGDLTGGGATSISKRYVVGPALDVGLPFGLAVEFDALYRRTGYRTSTSNGNYSIVADERANVWELPILLKYKLPFPVAKPFLEAGYAPRIIGSTSKNEQGVFPVTGQTFSTFNSTWSTSHGLIIGGGVQLAVGRLRLSPVIRYTRWNNSAVHSCPKQL